MAGAGERAAEQARRAAVRADRHRALADAAEQQRRAWAAGAAGERLVAEALTPLEAEGWVLLHDVRWPVRARANLDHVAVGPGGVVVVDAKNWSGEVTVRGGMLRVGSWRKDRELDAVASATAAVAALLPPGQHRLVRGALCLVQHDLMARPTSSGVAVVGREHLLVTLRGLPTVLSPADLAEVIERLLPHLLVPATGGATLPGARPEPRRPTGRPRTARPRPQRPRRRRSTGATVVERLLQICFALVIAWFASTQLPELASSMIIPGTP